MQQTTQPVYPHYRLRCQFISGCRLAGEAQGIGVQPLSVGGIQLPQGVFVARGDAAEQLAVWVYSQHGWVQRKVHSDVCRPALGAASILHRLVI